jgi:fibronectin-binding autotransporter adhesin
MVAYPGTVSGNLSVSGTASVTGAATLSGGASVTGGLTSDTVTVAGLALDGNATVTSATNTITGVTAATLALGGPTVVPAAGQAYLFDVWGSVTTTVSTQTITFAVYLGGVSGTSVLSLPITPNAGAIVTGAEMRMHGTLVFRSSTTALATAQVDINYFPSSVNRAVTTVTSGSQQLVVGLTPSASAESITVDGGFWRRIN